MGLPLLAPLAARRAARSPQLSAKIRKMGLSLFPLVQLDTGLVHPAFPATILHFWLLTDDELDELAHFYHQRTPGPLSRQYPCPVNWPRGLSLEEKRRKMGKFIGLRGCETPPPAPPGRNVMTLPPLDDAPALLKFGQAWLAAAAAERDNNSAGDNCDDPPPPYDQASPPSYEMAVDDDAVPESALRLPIPSYEMAVGAHIPSRRRRPSQRPRPSRLSSRPSARPSHPYARPSSSTKAAATRPRRPQPQPQHRQQPRPLTVEDVIEGARRARLADAGEAALRQKQGFR